MKPRRLAVKFFLSRDPATPVDLEPFIALFHRFIQEASVDGLLLDVADYAHVPDGPGILLVGHEVDYGVDLQFGGAGLLVVRKRLEDEPLADALRDTLKKALGAIQAIEASDATGVRFATDAVLVQVFDRLAGPNDEHGYAALETAAAPVLEKAFAPGFTVERAHADDARRALALRVRASEAESAATLAGRL